MASQQLKPMTLGEFLRWSERQPGGRFELIHGQPVPMASERARHARVKNPVTRALEAAVASAHLTCEVMPDGMAVPIRGTATREPDALVYCGPRLPDDALLVPNPIIVVEVKSPSTAGTDAWDKLDDYLAVPSIHHYLIVDADARKVIHHRRLGEIWQVVEVRPDEVGTNAALLLDPPGLTLAASEFFPRD